MSRELDLETLTRPDGIVPVDVETTAQLVRHVLRLRVALIEIEHHSTDPNAAATARAALAVHGKGESGK